MNQVEHAAQAVRHPPNAADIGEAIKAKLDDCVEANPASRATEDGKDTSDGRSSYTNIGIDSGYATQASSLSQAHTGAEKTGDEVVRGAGFFRRKLRIIDRPIPQAAMERLANARILLSKPLKEHISRPNPHEFTILWKLKYLGATDTDASLYLVVSCDKHIASNVKRFFAQTHIREQIGSDLGVHVHPLPPIKLNSLDRIPVLHDKDNILSQTLCGTPIAIEWNGQVRTATVGGVVMIYDSDSPDGKIFGITAGHVASSCLVQVGELDEKQQENVDEELSDDETFDEDFELDIEFHDAETQEPQCLEQVLEADDIRRRYIYPIGTLIADVPTDNDWTLIKLDPSRCLPNHLPSLKAHSDQQELSCGEEPPLGSEMAAIAVCALSRDMTASDLVHGTISRCGSGIMLSSGCQFVEAYDFKPKQPSRLSKGDSGSWIVDEKTGFVYGQVVAVDAFGEAVIIPMLSILKEIESRLTVIRACLPSTRDVQTAAILQGVANLKIDHASTFEFHVPKTTSTDSGYGSTSNDNSTNADGTDISMRHLDFTPFQCQFEPSMIAGMGLSPGLVSDLSSMRKSYQSATWDPDFFGFSLEVDQPESQNKGSSSPTDSSESSQK